MSTEQKISPLKNNQGVGYEEEYHQQVYGWIHDDEKYSRKSKLLAERFYPFVKPTDEVFEYGLGLGINLYKLPVAKKEGYDISEYARNFSNEKGIKTYASESDIPKQAYDYVISSHCVEHMENPTENLRFLQSLLKPTGKLVLILPVEKRYIPKSIGKMDVHQHLFGWTFRTIDNLLTHCGYQVLENRYISAGFRPYSVLRSRSKLLFEAYMKLESLFRPLHKRHMQIIAQRKQ